MNKRKTLFGLVCSNFKKKVLDLGKIIPKKYNQMKDYLENGISNTKNIEFENLAPKDNIDNGDEYFKALDWALKEPKILNIALTGPYGSGKSSVIKAYLKKHPSLKFINISLASFLEINDEGKQTIVDLGGEEKIEEGVLKQLFYKVDYKKIPQSRYRKLHKVSGAKIFRNLIVLGTTIGVTFFYFFPTKLQELRNNIEISGAVIGVDKTVSEIIAGGLVCLILLVLSYALYWVLPKYRVKEINISDKGSVTSKSEDNESILNKNMDEIVYFFEATDFNIVFIEDLDRFESAEIFIKLRELNTILNNYEMINRRIVFVYAIKDDIFVDKDRTKFFDFIIPIIPIINATNSNEILLKRLQKDEENGVLKYDISQKFITQISPYIDDMRILTNIYNEFVIYKNTLSIEQGLTLIDEQIMSLIIFKNLYPKEFAELQKETGIVKEAFDSKRVFIELKYKELTEERAKLEIALEDIEDDVLHDISELKAAMLYYLSGKTGTVRYIIIKDTTVDFEGIMADDFDMNILAEGEMTVKYMSNTGSSNNLSFKSIEEIDPSHISGEGVIKRWSYLKESAPERRAVLQKKIENLKYKEHEIKSLKIKSIIDIYGSENALPETVRNNRLLIYFLRNGYIDETYANYMNYFHANSITRDDMNFILGIRNFEAKEYSYPLVKYAQIVERLLEYEFEQKEIYNFALLEYLLEYNPNSKKCELFIRQLADEDDESWEFINEFIDITKQQQSFINMLSHEWINIWKYIMTKASLTADRIIHLFNIIVENIPVDSLVTINVKDNVSATGYLYDYIVNDPDILQKIKEIDESKIMWLFDGLKIILKRLNCTGISNQILDYIFGNNYYKINEQMLNNFVMFKQPDKINDLSLAHYTVLSAIGDQRVLNYIDDNFILYIDDIILGIETNTEECIESVIYMLEKLIETPDRGCKLIEKQNINIQVLSDCCGDKVNESNETEVAINCFWDKFLLLNKVARSWSNIMIYWRVFNLTTELLAFIESNIVELVEGSDKDDLTDDFVKSVLVEKMNLDAYKLFLENCVVQDFTNNISEFSEDQMRIMLDMKYFSLAPIRLAEMREIFPDFCVEFILAHKNEFMENIDDYALDNMEVERLIMSPETTDDEKIVIVERLELLELTTNIAHAIRNMKVEVNKDIVEQCWGLLPEENRYELFLNQIRQYSLEEISKKFIEFGDVYAPLGDRTRRHEVKLDNTLYNGELLEYLKGVGYLTSIKYESKIVRDSITYEDKEIVTIVGRVKAERG